MKTATLLCVVLMLAIATTAIAARPRWNRLHGYTFEQYKKDFRKEYFGKEQITRASVFAERLREIMAHNEDPTQTYKKGVNEFTDWTVSELKTLRGYRRDMGYKSRGSGIPASRPLATRITRGVVEEFEMQVSQDIPANVDWRQKGVVTSVKDQGMCGSCWSFAAAETIEAQWALLTGELATISEQNILDCTHNPEQCGGTGGCQGGTCELAFGTLANNTGKIASEWVYPYLSYKGKDYSCKATDKTPWAANVVGFTKLPVNQQQPLLNAVATTGPIAISVDASDWHSYESGVFNGCNQTNPVIDHAVQLVGYGVDPILGDYWLVRNSWAPTWGEDGYIRLARPATPTCGVDLEPLDGTECVGGAPNVTVCGTCGILYDSSYPHVSK